MGVFREKLQSIYLFPITVAKLQNPQCIILLNTGCRSVATKLSETSNFISLVFRDGTTVAFISFVFSVASRTTRSCRFSANGNEMDANLNFTMLILM